MPMGRARGAQIAKKGAERALARAAVSALATAGGGAQVRQVRQVDGPKALALRQGQRHTIEPLAALAV